MKANKIIFWTKEILKFIERFVNGIYSNFSICCVWGWCCNFFGNDDGKQSWAKYWGIDKKHVTSQLLNWGYIPCRKCFQNGKKRIVRKGGIQLYPEFLSRKLNPERWEIRDKIKSGELRVINN